MMTKGRPSIEARAVRRERIRAGLEQPPSHGPSGYGHGCLCEVCSGSQRASNKRGRRKRSMLPADRIPHGENGYVNYSCRCDVCRKAGSLRNAAHADAVRTRTGRERRNSGWTPEQDALVRRSDLTARQVAELVGRTAKAVACRRHRLRRAGRA